MLFGGASFTCTMSEEGELEQDGSQDTHDLLFVESYEVEGGKILAVGKTQTWEWSLQAFDGKKWSRK